jgi:glycerol-3-phosphate acyltransferase PlsX
MGADFSPKNEVQGAILAQKELGQEVAIILSGDKHLIEAELKSAGIPSTTFTIIDAPNTITMTDEPVAALRTKRDSSIVRGLDAVRSGSADAFVSAGNTGAVMSAATLELGRIRGVSRPTIGSLFPRSMGGYTLVFDVGATVDAKAHWLREYAVMATVYAREILGVTNPTVALLSVGEEASKGNELVFASAELIKETNVNFVGNVEGRDVLNGKVDIILCDGFTGNVILKFAGSVLPALKTRIKRYSEGGIINKLKAAVTASVLRTSLKDFDYQEYGGVPLLGVKGIVIIGHGSSSPLAIKNMIRRAAEMTRRRINEKIEVELTKLTKVVANV